MSAFTIEDLVVSYRRHAAIYYRSPDGRPTGEVHAIRDAMPQLVALFGRTPAAAFGPKALRAVRDAMIDAGLSRGLVNRRIGIVKRMFRWAVADERMPPDVLAALVALPGLRPGRSRAREAPPVLPVPESDVRAVLPHVPPAVQAMIELQLLTGMRPGEVVILRPRDIERTSDAAWVYSPARHKTRHLGRARKIPLGPRAQAILRPFLDGRAPEAFAFSPRESSEWRLARVRSRGKPPAPRRTDARAPRERYDVDSYRRAIARGARRAQVPHWHPNRLRHTAATRLRREFGLEAAAAILGHGLLETTQIYAEADEALARRIMGEIG